MKLSTTITTQPIQPLRASTAGHESVAHTSQRASRLQKFGHVVGITRDGRRRELRNNSIQEVNVGLGISVGERVSTEFGHPDLDVATEEFLSFGSSRLNVAHESVGLLLSITSRCFGIPVKINKADVAVACTSIFELRQPSKTRGKASKTRGGIVAGDRRGTNLVLAGQGIEGSSVKLNSI